MNRRGFFGSLLGLVGIGAREEEYHRPYYPVSIIQFVPEKLGSSEEMDRIRKEFEEKYMDHRTWGRPLILPVSSKFSC